MRKTSAVAPGKLMLFGEYAVLFGKRCIVTAVESGDNARAAVQDSDEFRIYAGDYSCRISLDSAEFPREVSFVAHAVREFCISAGNSKPVAISTKCSFNEDGMKLGLGSSAAVTAATVSALSAHFGSGLSLQGLFDVCFRAVRASQGTGSGFDVAASLYGGTLVYSIGSPLPIKCESPDLIIAFTGTPVETVPAIRSVEIAAAKNPERFAQLFEEIALVSAEAGRAIGRSDWGELGLLMSRNHSLLKSMGCPSREFGASSPVVEKLVSAAIHAGAYGAKLSGAGGDCIIAISPEDRKADVISSIVKAGGKIIKGRANAPGARVI